MNERVKFIADVLKGEESITELCLHYAIPVRPVTSGSNASTRPDLLAWKTGVPASKLCARHASRLSLQEQQDRFDRFQHCFNNELPHEALAFATPASVYVASTRRYPSSIKEA